jgi:methylase of polypeptide subunit release factors
MTIAIPNAYDEIIDFIAAGLTPTSLIAFQPSEAAKERVAELIFREKNMALSMEEKAELDRYMVLEHLLRLAKVRAHQHLAVA